MSAVISAICHIVLLVECVCAANKDCWRHTVCGTGSNSSSRRSLACCRALHGNDDDDEDDEGSESDDDDDEIDNIDDRQSETL